MNLRTMFFLSLLMAFFSSHAMSPLLSCRLEEDPFLDEITLKLGSISASPTPIDDLRELQKKVSEKYIRASQELADLNKLRELIEEGNNPGQLENLLKWNYITGMQAFSPQRELYSPDSKLAQQIQNYIAFFNNNPSGGLPAAMEDGIPLYTETPEGILRPVVRRPQSN